MKTHSTTVVLLVAAALVGFFFQLGERRVIAAGACTASPCENIYAWWAGSNAGGTVSSAQVAGATWPFMPADNTTYAILNVNVSAASGTTGPLVTKGTYDRWNWPDNTATCAPVNGQWPSPQVVIPQAPGGQKPTVANAGSKRFVCTQVGVGQQ